MHCEEMNSFDLTPTEIPVRISGQEFLLREASAEASSKWNEARIMSATLDNQGNMIRANKGAGDVGTGVLLVSLCMFQIYEVNGEKKDRPVTLSQIKSWPDRVTDALYTKILSISPTLQMKKTLEILEKQRALLEKEIAALKTSEAISRSLEDGPKN